MAYARISFQPAHGAVYLCPLCLHKENVRHPIEFFDLWPQTLTTEGSLITSQSLCGRTGIIILQSPDGWFTQDPARSADAEFLGDLEEDDDAHDREFD